MGKHSVNVSASRDCSTVSIFRSIRGGRAYGYKLFLIIVISFYDKTCLVIGSVVPQKRHTCSGNNIRPKSRRRGRRFGNDADGSVGRIMAGFIDGIYPVVICFAGFDRESVGIRVGSDVKGRNKSVLT